MASTYLSRTFGTATSRLICTASMWVKRSALGSAVFWNSYNSGTYRFQFYFDGSNRLGLLNVDSGSNNVELITNRVFRDVSAYYHLQAVIDTTQGTASDRVKIYVNGVQETSFATETYPSQNADMSLGADSYSCQIGRYGGGSDYFEGSMSHIHFIDGTAYDASAFGEYDANGVWKIKTDVSVTYGNEGFFILKDGNSVTDQSGNGNNFTVGGGTLTNTEDSPSNVFATFNLILGNTNGTFTNGNLTYQSPSANPVFGSVTTLGMSSGKYYMECKYSAGANHYLLLGLGDDDFVNGDRTNSFWDLGKYGYPSTGIGTIGYVVNTGAYRIGNNNTSWGIAGGDGDIISVAIDRDNNKIWFGVNGVWGNSGNPATGTNGIDVSSILTKDTWYFGVSNDTSGTETIAQFNFGNGYFGTTAVSSAGTNASGNGIFEYDVPTGYTALSTKGLNL